MDLETWRINLFGRLQAQSDQRTLNGLAMRRTGALLAYLAVRTPHAVPREELLALLWPEEPTDIARNRLRVLLNTLKQNLEPAGVISSSVLVAERYTVRLASERFTSDYHDFLDALQSAKDAISAEDTIRFLEQALICYQGEFLAGFYDEWILSERSRLFDLRYHALRELTFRLMSSQTPERAIEYARQAVAAEPLDEEAHCDLIRLYELLGQPSASLRQFAQLKRLLQEELKAAPSAKAHLLAARIEEEMGHGVSTTKRSVRAMSIRASEMSSSQPIEAANLPLRLTRFFGRQEERAYLQSLLAPESETRLVSLLGPGGVGKTRLAQEVAESLAVAYEGRVTFVSLSDCTDVNYIGAHMARALRLSPVSGLDPLSQVLTTLQNSPSLLILDNMEQLLPDAAPLIEQMLLEAIPLRFLLTSRRSAGIEGEREIPLRPLPPPDGGADIEELVTNPAIALFLDRVQAVRYDFALTPGNAADVVALCTLLEGLPLAIELAAARARVMTPAEMRNQTGQLLDWLVDIRGGKAARHRSVRATLEWSFRLLSAEERRFFIRLAVFSGGFTVEAAAAVATDGESHGEALALLERLRDASLLTLVGEATQQARFGMLETLREFGKERLKERGAEMETSRRHLAYFAELWFRNEPSQTKPWQWDASRRSSAEADESNLREALEFGLRSEATGQEQRNAVHLAIYLTGYWEMQGRWQEGRAFLLRAVGLLAATDCPEEKIALLQGAGYLSNLLGDYQDAYSLSEQGLALAVGCGDAFGMAGCLSNLGTVAFYRDDYICAQQRFKQAYEIYQQNGADQKVASCLLHLGNVAFFLGNHEEAKAHMHHALRIYRRLNDAQGVASVLVRLGNIWRNQSHFNEGRTFLREALEIYRGINYKPGIANCLHDLGLLAYFQSEDVQSSTLFAEAKEHYQAIGSQRGANSCRYYMGHLALARGNYDEAMAHYEEAMAISRHSGDRRNLAFCLITLGSRALDEGKLPEARKRFDEALEIEREINSRGGMANVLTGLGRLAIVQNDLQAARLSLEDALLIYHEMGIGAGVVEVLEAFAELAGRQCLWRYATLLTGAAERLREELGYKRSLVPQRREEALKEFRANLDSSAYAKAWQHGAALSLSDLVAQLQKDC